MVRRWVLYVMNSMSLQLYCLDLVFVFVFLMHVFLSYALSLICEAILCLEFVFAELEREHYNQN